MSAPARLRRHAAIGAGAIAFSLLLWAGLAAAMASPVFLPSPVTVFLALIRMIGTSALWFDVGASLGRIAVGFGASLIVAVPLGILAGGSRAARAAIEPVAAVVRYIPPSAFVPISILWFGIGETAKHVVIFVGVAPYVLVMVADAIAGVPQEYLDAARTLGATTWGLYRRVIVPFGLPGIWDAMRVMIGAAWTFIIVAEITAAESGLGFRLIQAQRFLRTPEVLSYMILVGFLGLLTDAAFQAGYKALFPWAQKARR